VKPLAIDLCAGLGGWTEGLLAEGWRVRGYDIEAHEYGDERYPTELVLQDVLTLNGADLAEAELIVASPPCTEYSYMAMPWRRAKQIARALRGEDEFPEGYKGSRTIPELTALFDACFRIQREASEAAGRHIPMVVENVKGAQPWVGRAPWSFGSYFLWGDIPALMPIQKYHQRLKVPAGEQWNVNRENFTGTRGWDEGVKAPGTGHGWKHPDDPRHQKGLAFNPAAQGAQVREELAQRADGHKNPGFRFDGSGRSFQSESVERHVEGVKNPGRSLDKSAGDAKFNDRKANFDADPHEGRKGAGAGAEWFDQNLCQLSSKSSARKAASAKIAKIPEALSRHIARVYLPSPTEAAA
jgi:hypothetical protein